MPRRFSIGMLLIVLLLPFVIPAATQAAPSATEQVRQTVEKVLSLLGNKALDETSRREQLKNLIQARFDFALMSQWTLGTYWRQANADQKQRFTSLYSELLEASYLGKIEAYTNEKVNFLSEMIEGQRAQVESEIVTGQANIPLSYRLNLSGEEWRVYDVMIEGVSLVRTYRGTFGEIARKEGIDGLLKQLEKKVQEQKQTKKEKG